ncbi:cupin domain-containing protein, partial [Streptomyces sp. NPDC058398]|uniref:AraC family transcriptional regulator n=1 Tax=Streptomyces sp. NPDC058398 TaxID=3346479 RepID=UPI003654AF7A
MDAPPRSDPLMRGDPLASLLEGPRARGAFMIRACFDPPWCVRVEDRAPLTIMLVVRGDAVVVPDRGEGLRLRAGDLAIARGPDPYVCADDPGTLPQAVILPGGECSYPDGRSLKGHWDLGVRSWGDRLDGSTVLLIGTYMMRGEVNGRLLDALPPLLALPSDVWECPLTPILAAEMTRDEPGQEVVLDRLLDLLMITALRAWFSRPEAAAPAWYRALADPVVGRALRLLQDDPARPWTVGGLAAETGVSRAALARRFGELVGEPPRTYLTGWRPAAAADRLRESDDTLETIARHVGYG